MEPDAVGRLLDDGEEVGRKLLLDHVDVFGDVKLPLRSGFEARNLQAGKRNQMLVQRMDAVHDRTGVLQDLRAERGGKRK